MMAVMVVAMMTMAMVMMAFIVVVMVFIVVVMRVMMTFIMTGDSVLSPCAPPAVRCLSVLLLGLPLCLS